MKYIRTKNGIMKIDFEIEGKLPCTIGIQTEECGPDEYQGIKVLKQADTIEELIQIGDIIFFWSSLGDREYSCLMSCDTDIVIIKNQPITKLLIPVGEDYKCVAKGYPSFNLIIDKKYLVNKGKLELL